MAFGNLRKKRVESPFTVASTSTSGTTGDTENAVNADAIIYFINITTATAGTITFKIQMSADDGTSWCDLTTAEMLGDTGAIGTGASSKHVSAAVPFGVRTRLAYTIVTGPFAFTVIPVFERTGVP